MTPVMASFLLGDSCITVYECLRRVRMVGIERQTMVATRFPPQRALSRHLPTTLGAVGEQDDATLLARMARRDPDGLATLYDRYGGVAFALAYRILHDRPAAEDIVQEAFFNAWRRAATYSAARGTARSWLLTIVHHQTIDHLRAMRSRGGTAADIDAITPIADGADMAAAVEQGVDGEWVRAAVATLPPEQRQVVMLAYFGGLTQSEITHSVAIPLGTVKGRMRLALEKLRTALPERG